MHVNDVFLANTPWNSVSNGTPSSECPVGAPEGASLRMTPADVADRVRRLDRARRDGRGDHTGEVPLTMPAGARVGSAAGPSFGVAYGGEQSAWATVPFPGPGDRLVIP